LQFYYSYVLRVDKKEEISGDIERADIGKFVHQVLSQYFSKRKGYVLKEKDIEKSDLNLLIEILFGKEYGKNPGGAVYLLKKQIKRHLKDFFEKYFVPLIRDETVSVLNCEENIRIAKNSFNLRGRLDAIFKRGEKTVIVDYKTGSNPNYLKINFEKLDIENRGSWSGAIGSLQLPFYLMLYLERTGNPLRNVNGMFLLLGRSLISREIELPLFTKDDGEEKYELLNILLFRMLREIVDPALPFRPAIDRKKTCPDCSYQYICGTQWIVK
jgi:CRISPR/Cas system-associated exonuclease Cas4 (RecB family)